MAQVYAPTEETTTKADKWYVGIGGGCRWNNVCFSRYDDKVFTHNSMTTNGVFSFFLERNFGREGHWGLAPTLAILKRGGQLDYIYDKDSYYKDEKLENVLYRIGARYVDVRLPIFYQFGKRSHRVRPYLYVAPVLGIATGGSFRAEEKWTDNSYAGQLLEVTKGNLAPIDFAADFGLGLKFFFNGVYLALEASYEYGITDTYAQKERDKKAYPVENLFYETNNIRGTRRFSGVEAAVRVGIPMSAIFKRKCCDCNNSPQPVQPTPMPPTQLAPVAKAIPATPVASRPQPQPAPVAEERPCYSLEEICDMMNLGENVYGKTICATEDIQFETGKSNIMPVSYEYLDLLAKILKQTGLKVEIKGHTDNVGSALSNMQLSQNRAIAVRDYLIARGVERTNLACSYYGMSRPIADNSTEEGRFMNRRVEFELLK